MGRLLAKTAIITGAAGGLGKAHVMAMLREGANVVATDRNIPALEILVKNLDAPEQRFLALQHDVTEEESWKSVVTATVERFGRLDILVNNAAISESQSIEETTLAAWRRTMAANLDGPFLGTKLAIETMRYSGGGSIVNICSMAAEITSAVNTAYSASKAGVRLLTKSAALHCAEQGYNIRVNSVSPGAIDTDMLKLLRDNPETRHVYDQMLESMPLKRLARPEEIANAVVFLASDESSYCLGTDMMVDGAFTCR